MVDQVEGELVRFENGSVVQLVRGDPGDPEVVVADLGRASIHLTSTRVAARCGADEWSWLLCEIEQVLHGRGAPWTILAVPGVPDHGVAVRPDEADEFRRRLDAVIPPAAQVGDAEPAPLWRKPGRDSRPEPGPDHGPESAGAVAPPVAPDPSGRPESWARWAGVGWDRSAALAHEPPEERPQPPAQPPAQPTVEPVIVRVRAEPAGGLVSPEVAPTQAGLVARRISAWFGSRLVLEDVTLAMPPGKVTALIGPSGCGKSTFLRILNRMHEMIPGAAMAGEVLLDGSDIYDADRRVTAARRQIGMVFQKPNPFPAMSIYDNVLASFQLTGRRAANAAKDEVVETCLRKAGLWAEVRDRLRQPGGSLSGGQQQRLCIARALAIKPRVLLMDEPCSALDPTSTRRIEQTIGDLSAEVTIVIVTHNMQQAARVSHQCAFFLAEQGTPGVIVEHGLTEAMFHDPQDPRTNDYVNGRFG